ncbi:hypothetical protein E2C01_030946 [Portunus trituberculatus]|uniref:Uncharacterized protein n=1 Tax=Portunus trituberculatus TaxID=210409 RepID=A0A5B7EWA1_PORTR|nr:hypothetical protein [Portunus trituberculatus]
MPLLYIEHHTASSDSKKKQHVPYHDHTYLFVSTDHFSNLDCTVSIGLKLQVVMYSSKAGSMLHVSISVHIFHRLKGCYSFN